MKLLRIGVSNFRSIGEQPVIIDLQKRINLLIGANNAGKSNVLIIFERLRKMRGNELVLKSIDRHRRDEGIELEITADLERTEEHEFPDEKVTLRFTISGKAITCLSTPFDDLDYRMFEPYMRHWQNRQWQGYPNDEQLRNERSSCAAGIAHSLGERIPAIRTIPQFRQIVPGEYDLNGTGVVELLSHWKAPDIGKEIDRDRFHRLRDFLRELLTMDDVDLDVSRKSTELIVERVGLRLPLKNYGTGIHQLIILAIAVLAHDGAWIAIEEPEIHLHPLLQKAFLRFLVEKTTNHYLITTHSNAFLSRPQDSHIIHLWLENGETKNRVVETTSHILEVLTDLGIRAADILQANFALWVEGPSDRIYLKHWLKLADPKLAEGIDYSIMFYGGRLLAHLSMERDDGELTTDELIKLLRINQHSAILIDSDRHTGTQDLNATKSRVQKECETAGVLCWVTDGREVENYIAPETFAAAYKEKTGVDRTFKLSRFEKIDSRLKATYEAEWKPSYAYEDDKVGFARRLIQHMPAIPDRFELPKRIDELVARIGAAR